MLQAAGEDIEKFPFEEIKKVSDLIEFDGPILSHFKDASNQDILFYWVDFDKDFNRWAVFSVSELLLTKYLNESISLYSLINRCVDGVVYFVDIPYELKYTNIKRVSVDAVNEKYLPEKTAFYHSCFKANS